ncbi:hypothetical protein DL768_006878 [Monosporascus sp. mg162]|nr:hypothetical protein DL768_006878 [Monosporascus sp. mg162]
MQLLPRISGPHNGGSVRAAVAALPGAVLSRQTGAAAASRGVRWSSSNSQWKQRQSGDYYAHQARVQHLRSRAAFKLFEIDNKYKLFKRGQTVVDLVALERTKPHGRVVGIDLLPAQPPPGVSAIQGNFLSPAVQNLVKEYLFEHAERPVVPLESAENNEDVLTDRPSYIEFERADSIAREHEQPLEEEGRLVDVVLSDMSEPWAQCTGRFSNTLSNPYRRMMNTSGMKFRDHAGSMDLCLAALQFASDTLRGGGHFVCKFYQGAEDKALEMRLKKMFGRVHREKPESSRNESREAYFVALRIRHNAFASSETDLLLKIWLQLSDNELRADHYERLLRDLNLEFYNLRTTGSSSVGAIADATPYIVHSAFRSLQPEAMMGTTGTPLEINNRFSMVYLMKNYRWRVLRTNSVIDHLLVDLANKMVKVYKHKICRFNQRNFSDDCPIPRKVLREALETRSLLFPPNDPETQQYLHRQDRPFHKLGFCGEGNSSRLGHYRYWQNSLGQLAGELERETYGWRQLLPDKNLGNLSESATFWLTTIVAIVLALGSDATSTCVAGKAYNVALAQHDLALAQVCFAPGANITLPKHCL